MRTAVDRAILAAVVVAAITSTLFLVAAGAYVALAVPPIICSAPLFARRRAAIGVAVIASQVALLGFMLLGAASVGLYFGPSFVLLVIARHLHARQREPNPES